MAARVERPAKTLVSGADGVSSGDVRSGQSVVEIILALRVAVVCLDARADSAPGVGADARIAGIADADTSWQVERAATEELHLRAQQRPAGLKQQTVGYRISP